MNIFDYCRLKELREEKELPLNEIAAQLNIQPNVYARYERGIAEPDITTVNKIAEILGCPADDLIRTNVTVVDGYSFTSTVAEELDGILKMISEPDRVSSLHAKCLLKRLNKILIPISLSQIVYSPEKLNINSCSNIDIKLQQRVVALYKRFKYVHSVLSSRVSPELPPLMKKVKFPVLNEPHKIPLINTLSNTLLAYHEKCELLLPDFSQSGTIVVFSDYGGDSGQESFLTYSFLFADYDSVASGFDYSMQALRRKYFKEYPEKEIAFKDIKNGHIKNSLWDYLCEAGNTIHGLLFTLVIDRRIKSMFGDIKSNAKSFSNQTQVEWKPKVAEKLFRIDTVISYFLTLLGRANQKVFWLADDDAIMENEEKANIAAKSMISLLNAFEHPVQFELYGYGKNSSFRSMYTSVFTDALSLTDLVGGAVNYYFTWKMKQKNSKFKPEADMICRWLTEQNLSLNKFGVLIKADNKDLKKLSITPLRFRLKPGEKMPGDAITYIDIPYPTIIESV